MHVSFFAYIFQMSSSDYHSRDTNKFLPEVRVSPLNSEEMELWYGEPVDFSLNQEILNVDSGNEERKLAGREGEEKKKKKKKRKKKNNVLISNYVYKYELSINRYIWYCC